MVANLAPSRPSALGRNPVRVSARRAMRAHGAVPQSVRPDDGVASCSSVPGTQEVSVDWVSSVLDGAGIDHSVDCDDMIYITGIGFPAWLSLDHDSRAVIAVTHCDGAEGLDEVEALRFANHCNETYLMAQFVWSQGVGRLYGHLTVPFADGLARRQLLRSLTRFGSIFARAVAEGAACAILEPPVAQGVFID